jgi:hypothetical protein
MKLITLISIITYTTSAYSFDFNNFKNMFNTLVDAEPKVEQENEHCCDPTAEELEQINQCAIDLCGKSGTVDSVYVSNDDYENFYKDADTFKDYEEFKPKLKKYLDTVRANTKEEMEAIKSKSATSNPDYFKLDSYTDEQISSMMSDELRSNIQVEIKKDKDGNKKINVTTMPSEVEVDEELKKKYVEYRINEIKTTFSTGIYDGYIELDEAIKFVKNAIDKHIIEVDNKISSTPPENTADLEQQKQYKTQYEEIKKKVDEAKELTKNNVTELYYSIQNINYQITTDLNLEYYNVPHKAFECGELKCKNYLSQKIPLIMSPKNLDEIVKQTKDEKKANELINDCEYFWHQDRLKKAKDGKKKEFVESIPRIIDKVKNNFSSKFSKESSSTLGKYFDNLKYVVADDPIPGRGDYNYLDYIKEEVLRVVEPKEDEETESYEDELKGILADYKKVKKHFMMGQVRFEHELTSCDEANANASDHFMPSEYDPDTYIHASSFSCNHYTTGKQVFAHELGHAISGQFMHDKTSDSSAQKYKGHRDCISKNYKDKTFSGVPMWKEFSHKGDTKYTEEDMADFVAGLIYNNPNENLLSCALIATDVNNVDFDREKLSVLNPLSYDTHSSPFLRTLKEAILKNKVLTPSCRTIIDKYKDRINFNKCEF